MKFKQCRRLRPADRVREQRPLNQAGLLLSLLVRVHPTAGFKWQRVVKRHKCWASFHNTTQLCDLGHPNCSDSLSRVKVLHGNQMIHTGLQAF
jgi:hypothetical protein